MTDTPGTPGFRISIGVRHRHGDSSHEHALQEGECRRHPGHWHEHGNVAARERFAYYLGPGATADPLCTDDCPRHEAHSPEPEAEGRQASVGRPGPEGTDADTEGRTCPHCGTADLDRGATGLDLCTSCGGLSRDGRPLGDASPVMFALSREVVHQVIRDARLYGDGWLHCDADGTLVRRDPTTVSLVVEPDRPLPDFIPSLDELRETIAAGERIRDGWAQAGRAHEHKEHTLVSLARATLWLLTHRLPQDEAHSPEPEAEGRQASVGRPGPQGTDGDTEGRDPTAEREELVLLPTTSFDPSAEEIRRAPDPHPGGITMTDTPGAPDFRISIDPEQLMHWHDQDQGHHLYHHGHKLMEGECRRHPWHWHEEDGPGYAYYPSPRGRAVSAAPRVFCTDDCPRHEAHSPEPEAEGRQASVGRPGPQGTDGDTEGRDPTAGWQSDFPRWAIHAYQPAVKTIASVIAELGSDPDTADHAAHACLSRLGQLDPPLTVQPLVPLDEFRRARS